MKKKLAALLAQLESLATTIVNSFEHMRDVARALDNTAYASAQLQRTVATLMTELRTAHAYAALRVIDIGDCNATDCVVTATTLDARDLRLGSERRHTAIKAWRTLTIVGIRWVGDPSAYAIEARLGDETFSNGPSEPGAAFAPLIGKQVKPGWDAFGLTTVLKEGALPPQWIAFCKMVPREEPSE